MFDDIVPLSVDDLKNYKVQALAYVLSPELHGRDKFSLAKVKSFLQDANIKPDAVCTKYDTLWSK